MRFVNKSESQFATIFIKLAKPQQINHFKIKEIYKFPSLKTNRKISDVSLKCLGIRENVIKCSFIKSAEGTIVLFVRGTEGLFVSIKNL